jgi:hypothetical protein
MGAAKKNPPKVWKKPLYRKIVEKSLRDYPMMKEAIQDREMTDLLPSCVPVYGEEMITGNSPFSSTTELYGIKRAERHSWERRLWVGPKTLSPFLKAAHRAKFSGCEGVYLVRLFLVVKP